MLIPNTTRARIYAGFGGATALLLVVGAVSWLGARGLVAHLRTLSTVRLPSVMALAHCGEGQVSVNDDLKAALLRRVGEQGRVKALAHAVTALADVEEGARKLEASNPSPEVSRLGKAWKDQFSAWRGRIDEVIRLLDDRNKRVAAGTSAMDPEILELEDRAWASYRDAGDVYAAASQALDALEKQIVDEASESAREADATGSRTVLGVGAAVALGTLLMAAIAFAMARRLGSTIRDLVAEAARLRAAVAAGQLDTRGDPAAVVPELEPVVAGMNETLDAFVGPFRVAAAQAERISRGDIPPPITEEYRGDFNTLKTSLNDAASAVNALVSDVRVLAGAAVDGRLSVRADAERHRGEFRNIVAGMNATLDAVVAPVRDAAAVLERLAARDLTARVHGDHRGDHARIAEAVNAAAHALHDALARVGEATRQVASAAAQIESTSQVVAAGASEQAASLEETSASLETIAATTKQAAGHAGEANALAQQARGAATEGAAVVQQMHGVMERIRASAEGTSQIIRDINEIAFQTNLLALNAAVEAARAGDAGRGFAVVAEEVRSLALRSKDAAHRTEELIRESVKKAGEGEATSAHVGRKLGEIVGAIAKVTDIVAEISASAREQAAGIDQVNRAVGEMDKVTQQNAASSEESSSAAAELSGQARTLAGMVASFTIDAATPGRPHPLRPVARA